MKLRKFIMKLLNRRCIPCEGKEKPLEIGEIKDFQALLKNPWDVIDNKKITKTFKFKDFARAMEFVNQIAAIAEREQHHPDLEIHYSQVIVTLWTHAINGLSENDFIMAAKIDEL